MARTNSRLRRSETISLAFRLYGVPFDRSTAGALAQPKSKNFCFPPKLLAEPKIGIFSLTRNSLSLRPLHYFFKKKFFKVKIVLAILLPDAYLKEIKHPLFDNLT